MDLADEFYGEDIRRVTGLGFTDRQARFLVTALVHAGVFVERQYCAFAGMAHGQKSHDFLAKLTAKRYAVPIAVGPLHQGRLWHLRSKPLYAAIGDPDNRYRRHAPKGRLAARLMLLDAVLADPTHVWLGTEHDKLVYFTLRLQTGLAREELPHLTFRREDAETIRCFPEKLPIGVSQNERRHVFVYLVTSHSTRDFRLFLLRHAELLRTVPEFTLRLLFPRPFRKAASRYQWAVRDELASPLNLHVVEELQAFFRDRLTHQRRPAAPTTAAFLEARRAYRGPRFQTLHRLWLQDGDTVVRAALSGTLHDAFERDRGRVECVDLSRQYLHLTHLIGVA
jgi:hypothetical protein